MESPTTDLSIEMEALKLGLTSVSSPGPELSSTDDRVMAKPTEQKTVAETPSSFKSLSDVATNHFVLTPAPPQFVNSPHTTQTSNKHTHHPYLDTHTLNTVCACTHQNSVCETCHRLKARRTMSKEDITESFNALQLTTDTVPHRAISCRQQEAAYSNYSSQYTLDDTTVDELAGYFEEMMYLPKPMSEMAELMYT